MAELNWDLLLSTDRLREDAEGKLCRYTQLETAPRTPAEADVQRIIFSAPFRRLAGKTQVHPLAEVDYVHNRLTHSLEVAEIGMSLAQRLFTTLGFSPERIQACAYHVKAACLGHDIGNPPYGHAGEYAIQSWVEMRIETLQMLLQQDVPQISDEEVTKILSGFRKFDGNAQAFRLLSQPNPRGDAYFRLSFASLGALIKYPRCAYETETAKFSCFHTSYEAFRIVTQALGLQQADGHIARHPLSYLTEIADDICYCVTDCEDAILMGILEESRVREWYLQLLEKPETVEVKAGGSISFLRAHVIGDLVRCFTQDLIEAFTHPERLETFEADSPTWQRLRRLKKRYSIVFDDAEKIQKELRAQREIHQTLDAFLTVVASIRDKQQDYFTLLLRKYTFGEEFICAHAHQSYVWWIHTMFDHVTGMTDAYLHRFSEPLREMMG